MSAKKVPILFYYVSVSPSNNGSSDDEFDWSTFLDEFRQMLDELRNADLSDRKEDFKKDEKVVWLDECAKLANNEIDIVMKSAKYNHIRNVIDTKSMKDRGKLKSYTDGDEEKTHLCLRYHNGNNQMICLFGNNSYGVGLGKILEYFRIKMKKWCEDNQKPFFYLFGKEIMPGDEFIKELRKMKAISLVTLTVHSNEFKDDFLHFAKRDETRKTVDVIVRKAKRKVDIPSNLVEAYYNDMNSQNRIIKMIVEGKNDNGCIKINTESIQMKQAINVDISEDTKEIISSSFFAEAQTMLDSLRNSVS